MIFFKTCKNIYTLYILTRITIFIFVTKSVQRGQGFTQHLILYNFGNAYRKF